MKGLAVPGSRVATSWCAALCAIAIATSIVGCDGSTEEDPPGPGAPGAPGGEGGDEQGGGEPEGAEPEGGDPGGGDPGGGGEGPELPVWTAYTHACPGPNRTDALHRDDDGTLWVGCGSGGTGYGLYTSGDGGASWAQAPVSEPDKLHQFRVNSISRGHDGALYVAGFSVITSGMVLRLDTDTSPIAVSTTLVAGNKIGTSFQVGTYRELSDGRALAESHSGTDMLYRPDASVGADATLWVDTYGWFGGGATQLTELAVHDDQFYGVGSTIATPPRLFLPPTDPAAAPYEFVSLTMPHGAGELWGIAVDESHVVAVGVDQDLNVGRVYVSGDDPYDVDGYLAHSLHDLIGVDASNFTWARGTCKQGDRIAVVGERQPLSQNTGIVVLSEDGGVTFTNITPPGAPSTVSKCLFRPDGGLVVAGSGGYLGIYR